MWEREIATLAGGCFWCLEAVFLELKGVEKVVSGYSGGTVRNPSYREVSTGTTGHAEAVQVSFDPEEITYRDILDVFFTIHDPTTLNRQGEDVGTQYRSAIFYHSNDQKEIAEEVIRGLDSPISGTPQLLQRSRPFRTSIRQRITIRIIISSIVKSPIAALVLSQK